MSHFRVNSYLKIPMVNKSTVWWLSGIMLLGALFRLSIYNLEPLFMDSAYYASLGRSISEGDYLLQVNHMSDKPPLFFYVQALFFQLLGVSESVAVLPSFVGGMIGIGIIYLAMQLVDSHLVILPASSFRFIIRLPMELLPIYCH